MAGFRRAQLRGSEELFQPTRTATGEPAVSRASIEVERPSAPAAMAPAPAHQAPEGRLVRLTEEDVTVLVEALQRLKFPGHKPASKPPVDEFERLEELRQKLLSVL